MKSLAIWIVLCVGCWGQQVYISPSAGKPETIIKGKWETVPAPLKCGKYEHVDPGVCHASSKDPDVICDKPHCAPDLHTVTEKEWQELQAELKTLRTAILQQIRK